jgi:hypothetical protein
MAIATAFHAFRAALSFLRVEKKEKVSPAPHGSVRKSERPAFAADNSLKTKVMGRTNPLMKVSGAGPYVSGELTHSSPDAILSHRTPVWVLSCRSCGLGGSGYPLFLAAANVR